MSNNVIDIIERFQTRHALQEEREVKKFDASTNSAAAAGVPDKNGKAKNNIFEMEEVRVWTVAVPGSTEWSRPARWPGSNGRHAGQNTSTPEGQ